METITGTSGDDSFAGVIDAAAVPAVSNSTFQTGDKLIGGGGTDTLTLTGRYAVPDQSVSEHTALAEVTAQAPNVLICLLSAPQFHGLTILRQRTVYRTLADSRVISHVDVERADLKGILEVLAAQVAPDLTEVTACTLKSAQRSQADSSVCRQIRLSHCAQTRLYCLGAFQTLSHWIGLAQLHRLQAFKLGIELPAHGQEEGRQRGKHWQQMVFGQCALGSEQM